MRVMAKVPLLVSVILVVLVAWANWHLNEDLYPALCAGRDVVEGRLAAPDQWSFTTGGKVWVNQAWLSGLAFYLSYVQFGQWGPIILKGLVLIACLPLLFYRCRRLGVSSEIALLAIAIGIVSSASYISMRPENFGMLWSVAIMVFLVMPRSLGIWRQVGCLLVVLIWSNSHGSFVLAFPLVALKMASPAVASLLRRMLVGRWTDGVEERGMDWGGKDTVLWAFTLLLCFPVTAYANPFGPANLLMPFTQVGTGAFLKTNQHWSPLILWDFPPRAASAAVRYFVLVLVSCCGLILTAVLMVGRRGMAEFLINGPAGRTRGDLLVVELGCTVLLLFLSFRYARLVLFAGPGIVPGVALLMQWWTDAFCSLYAARKRAAAILRSLGTILAYCFLILVLWFFTANTLIPHLPGNPVLPDCSLAKRIIGHFAIDLADVPVFMKRNGIKGRVFANWVLADYLLFHVPEIKIFIGCRAQSIYSQETLRDFMVITHINPWNRAQKIRALKLLDQYEVSTIVLESKPVLIPLIGLLCRSKQWDIVYVDPSALVFTRNRSPIKKPADIGNRLDKLWYPNELTRVVSRGYLEFYSLGTVSDETVARLKALALERPLGIIYNLLYMAGADSRGCLDGKGESYMLKELARLSQMNYREANGVNTILDSMIQILGFLAVDRDRCGKGRGGPDFGKLRASLRDRAMRIRFQSLPLGAPPWKFVPAN